MSKSIVNNTFELDTDYLLLTVVMICSVSSMEVEGQLVRQWYGFKVSKWTCRYIKQLQNGNSLKSNDSA